MQEKQLEIMGGILSYELAGEKVYIVGHQGTGSRVEVPEQIEGYPVTGIGKKAFLSQKSLHSIILPETMEEVGDWAFAYCDGLVQISFPDHAVRFGKAVFKECGRLERIEIRIPGEKGGRKVSETAGKRNASGRGEDGMRPEIREDEKAPEIREDENVPEIREDENVPEIREDEKAPEIREAEKRSETGIPELLAAAVSVMDAYYLLDLTEAGSMEWLAKWDARLAAILAASDQEGYSKQVLCGEEDYGSTDLEAFTSNRRKEKVRLAFLRLLHSQGLSGSWKAELENYLRSHTKGQPGEEAWQVLREEHGNDREYYELFTELACIHEDNFDAVLRDIGEEYPEMKAFFMRLREGKACAEDFFAGLEL